MFALGMMVGGAILGGIAGLIVGFGLWKVLEWVGLLGNYANSTDWPVIIVAGVGVVAGVVFAVVEVRDSKRREREITRFDTE